MKKVTKKYSLKGLIETDLHRVTANYRYLDEDTIEYLSTSGGAMNKDELNEIRDILLQARNETDYSIDSPQALDHLLVHVVRLIDVILESE